MDESARAPDLASFLKRHGFVIAGVMLPLLVVFSFGVARMLPKYLVEDPRYDLVYSSMSGYTGTPNKLSCDVACVNGRVRARWSRPEQPVYAPAVRVYRMRPADGAIEELPVPEPEDRDTFEGTQDLFLGGLDDVRIDTSPRAPDGYEFESTYGGGGGPFGGLFSSRSYGPRSTLKKGGRVIAVPTFGQEVYGTVTLLGWAIPREDGR